MRYRGLIRWMLGTAPDARRQRRANRSVRRRIAANVANDEFASETALNRRSRAYEFRRGVSIGIGEHTRTEADEIVCLAIDGEIDFVYGEGVSATIPIFVLQIRARERYDPWLGIALRVYGERIPKGSIT